MRGQRVWFVHFSQWICHVTGAPLTFLAAVAIIAIWALVGPIFGFSDTWQLIINTGTTIVTFLMVFVIQNTQNRDTASLHIKLDELILVTQKASNRLLDLDNLDEEELLRMKQEYERLARRTVAARHKKSRPRSAKRERAASAKTS
jgi:low affinity Fe/Cu permease